MIQKLRRISVKEFRGHKKGDLIKPPKTKRGVIRERNNDKYIEYFITKRYINWEHISYDSVFDLHNDTVFVCVSGNFYLYEECFPNELKEVSVKGEVYI